MNAKYAQLGDMNSQQNDSMSLLKDSSKKGKKTKDKASSTGKYGRDSNKGNILSSGDDHQFSESNAKEASKNGGSKQNVLSFP
jgi:hypothetical protein